MKVKSESEVTQSCPTLCEPMDCSLPGSSVHAIFQARVLEWGAIAFSGATLLSHTICWCGGWGIRKKYENFCEKWDHCVSNEERWSREISASMLDSSIGSFKDGKSAFSRISLVTISNTAVGFSSVQFSSVQSLSRVRLFATPWIAARQASLSITISQSSFTLTFIESVMPSSHPSSVVPFSSCPQSFPASESFPMSQLFKGQFSFQFQRKAMPKNAQTTAQLHSSHMLVK